jgi:hypothetical protein
LIKERFQIDRDRSEFKKIGRLTLTNEKKHSAWARQAKPIWGLALSGADAYMAPPRSDKS